MGKRDEQVERQRQVILTAAHDLFAERSFDEVTMAEIAAAAGVARATVFNQFSSKHGLVDAITEQVLSIYGQMLDESLADERTPTADLLRAMVIDMGQGIEADRAFFRGVFRELSRAQLTSDEAAGREAAVAMARDALETLFRRGIERGDINDTHDPFTLALAFTSLLNGVITEWLAVDDPVPVSQRLTDVANAFLGPVEKLGGTS